MDHLINESSDSIDMQHVADSAVEEIQVGSIISGEVVTVDSDYVYVNVGMKSDGRIPAGEFSSLPAVGEVLDVILKTKRFADGMYQFSHSAAKKEKNWRNFSEWYKEGNTVVSGRITGSVKSGKSAECMGVNAFLPFSLVGDLKAASAGDNEYEFVIKSVDPSKRSIIISRKDFIEVEKKKRWESFLEKYKAGDKIEGEIIKFVEFGAFVRVAGIDALLHRNDMSWKKVFKQRKLFKLGEVKEFVILDINSEEGKISLGYKQLFEDPWVSVASKYSPGDIVEGVIVTITGFGAFAEIDEGIEGFVSLNDISWSKRGVAPKDVFERNEKYNFAILDMNPEEKRLSLGYKQTLPNPWDAVAENYPPGYTGKGKITKIVKFGLFVELEDQIEGLVHISDITWDENIKDPIAGYKTGDTVDFKVLDVNKDEMKISLGMKQLEKSPWEVIREKYPPRSRVEGSISGIKPFGIFVKIEDNVEGLVHISEVSNSRLENLEDHFKIGDRVSAVVLDVDVDKKRLSLSIKHYDKISEKEEIDKIMKGAKPSAVTLGDLVDINWEK